MEVSGVGGSWGAGGTDSVFIRSISRWGGGALEVGGYSPAGARGGGEGRAPPAQGPRLERSELQIPRRVPRATARDDGEERACPRLLPTHRGAQDLHQSLEGSAHHLLGRHAHQLTALAVEGDDAAV